MEEILRLHMLTAARLYAAETDTKITAVATLAARDSGFFGRMERGEASFTVRKYDAVMAWFSDHWPTGLDWPVNVPRQIKASKVEPA